METEGGLPTMWIGTTLYIKCATPEEAEDLRKIILEHGVRITCPEDPIGRVIMNPNIRVVPGPEG